MSTEWSSKGEKTKEVKDDEYLLVDSEDASNTTKNKRITAGNRATFLKTFSIAESYEQDEVVVHNRILYAAKAAVAAGVFVADQWYVIGGKPVAHVTNTDIATNINGTATVVPLTGTTVSMEDGFAVSGDGIECRFDGKVEVVASINTWNNGGNDGRKTSVIRIAVDGVQRSREFGYYNRGAQQSGQNARMAGASLEDEFDVSNGQVITLVNTPVESTDFLRLRTAGGSGLIVRRVR